MPYPNLLGIPIYRVSPLILVTREHIISESSATSSLSSSWLSFSGVTDLNFSPSLAGSGDASELWGVEALPSRADVVGWGEIGSEAAWEVCLDCWCFSTSFFSKVPRSVAPLSSSPSKPIPTRSAATCPSGTGDMGVQAYLITSAGAPCAPSGSRAPRCIWLFFIMSANMLLKMSKGKMGDTHPLGGFRFFSTCVKTHSVL